MSYKTEFQSNNADLRTILDTVNTLPDAESGGGVSLSSFYLSYPTGETVRFCYDPSVCYDWLSFIGSEYNTGRFEADFNTEGRYCVVLAWDTSGYVWYISGTEENLDMPIEDGATYTVTYWVP